jgi:hypothetical protein
MLKEPPNVVPCAKRHGALFEGRAHFEAIKERVSGATEKVFRP